MMICTPNDLFDWREVAVRFEGERGEYVAEILDGALVYLAFEFRGAVGRGADLVVLARGGDDDVDCN